FAHLSINESELVVQICRENAIWSKLFYRKFQSVCRYFLTSIELTGAVQQIHQMYRGRYVQAWVRFDDRFAQRERLADCVDGI
ncbi:hypothetical protein, partial [Escherichia coli]|uniref:hypothetical protein n=1 Tax=Escherichia coli TaxID=562 RepID=UPI003CE472C9